MRKRLQNYIFLNRREEFWNIYCVLQFSIAFDLRSNDNIYRRNRTERSCFITSRWIEGQDLFVDNVNVLVLYLSRFVVAFFFLSSFLSYIVLILYSSNIIDYILSSHPEDKKQYDWIMKHWFALNSFVSTSFRLIKHNFLYSEATFDETLLLQSNSLFPEIKGDPWIHLLSSGELVEHLARRRGDTVSRVKWKILRSPSYARGRRNGPGGDRREGGRGLGRYRGQRWYRRGGTHIDAHDGALWGQREKGEALSYVIFTLSPPPLVRKVSIQLTCDPS